MEYQKITSLLGTISDNVPRFIIKKMDISYNADTIQANR